MREAGEARSSRAPWSVASVRNAAAVSKLIFRNGERLQSMPARLHARYPPWPWCKALAWSEHAMVGYAYNLVVEDICQWHQQDHVRLKQLMPCTGTACDMTNAMEDQTHLED